jgi:hypothetical protein
VSGTKREAQGFVEQSKAFSTQKRCLSAVFYEKRRRQADEMHRRRDPYPCFEYGIIRSARIPDRP